MNKPIKIDPVILQSDHDNRHFGIDIFYVENGKPKAVIIFVHGFKGFKDWGYFNLMSENFARLGYVFVKMNFSHNGVTADRPEEISDPETFGNNNFTIEQHDLRTVIDFIQSENFPVHRSEFNSGKIYLTGHSRGGASVVLAGFNDKRIKKVATWAAINDLDNHYTKEEMSEWKKRKVIYVRNNRNGEQLPMYYQIVENYFDHEKELDVPYAIRNLGKPLLVVHGTADETVPVETAYQTRQWNPEAELKILAGADHKFGGIHPWTEKKLPVDAEKAIQATVDFFND